MPFNISISSCVAFLLAKTLATLFAATVLILGCFACFTHPLLRLTLSSKDRKRFYRQEPGLRLQTIWNELLVFLIFCIATTILSIANLFCHLIRIRWTKDRNDWTIFWVLSALMLITSALILEVGVYLYTVNKTEQPKRSGLNTFVDLLAAKGDVLPAYPADFALAAAACGLAATLMYVLLAILIKER